MIFEARIHPRRFDYIEWFCENCKSKGVSMDTTKVKCPYCEERISHMWDQSKLWNEKERRINEI